MTNTVKLPWNSLIEIVYSDNFMNSTLVKNFTIVYLKMAYDRLTEKDKITYLSPLIKNIELKPPNQKEFLLKIILELLQNPCLKLSDLETKEVVDSLYSLYESVDYYHVRQKESLLQSQSFKSKIMYYLCKSKLAANIFPEMLYVSFDCLFSSKTDINLRKQGTKCIHCITRMADISILKLIRRVLLFGLFKIIKDTKIEKFNNLMTEQEINQTLLFRPFHGSLDLSYHNSEEDNEVLKVIIIKFHEINQLDQFDQWTNEENIKFSHFSYIVNLILEESTKCIHHLADTLQINQLTSADKNYRQLARMVKLRDNYLNGIGVEKDVHNALIYYQKSAEMGSFGGIGIGVVKDERKAFTYYQKSAGMGNADGICSVGHCYIDGIGIEKDVHRAFIYFQKSAEMGNSGGFCNLGNCYKGRIGVEKDEHKAFTYYQKSAGIGSADGICSVGHCYLDGIGIEKK
ncbi:hypothetical protein C2G38_2197380 [Gigaspora rosea]|uniref:Proteasome component Ecm29 N-terminal domain-containing protein n=1 Tax=Gigaspora rosea TaxID=44941 RepID=A0A397UVH1_9GLOM|nr:hypothetical protein C2G38_2197380 [Gigaspora rosea]